MTEVSEENIFDDDGRMVEFIMAGGTDIGHYRDLNEDCFGYEPLTRAGWAVVADGLGGHLGGDVASEMAIVKLTECFLESMEREPKPNVETLMEEAFTTTNATLKAHGRAHIRVAGMGTTLTAVYLDAINRQLVGGHVGDSRYYRWRKGHLEQMTQDHNLAGHMLREDPDCIPPRHAQSSLDRAVGPNWECETDVWRHEIRRGDKLLLCTDGLNGKLSDDEIAAILTQDVTDPQHYVEHLIRDSLAKGADDNVTVLVILIR